MIKNLEDFKNDFIQMQTKNMKESYQFYFESLFNQSIPKMENIQIEVDDDIENATIQFTYNDVLFTGKLVESDSFEYSVNPNDNYKLIIETIDHHSIQSKTVSFPLYLRSLKTVQLFLDEKTSENTIVVKEDIKNEVAQSILRAQEDLIGEYSLKIERLVNVKTGEPYDTKVTYKGKTIFISTYFEDDNIHISIENGIGERFSNGKVFLIRYNKKWNIEKFDVNNFKKDLEDIFNALQKDKKLSNMLYGQAEISYDYVTISNQYDEMLITPSTNGYVFIHKMDNAQPINKNLNSYSTFSPPYYFFTFQYDEKTNHLTISYMGNKYKLFSMDQQEAIYQVINLIESL